MLSAIAVTALFALSAIETVGSPAAVSWPRKEVGFQAADEVSLRVDGESAVTLEIRAPASMKNRSIDVEIVRDAGFVSSNTIRFRRMPRAPRGYPVAARLSFAVPEGAHTYEIRGLSDEMAMIVRGRNGVERKHEAAAEEAIPAEVEEETASAALVPEPEPELLDDEALERSSELAAATVASDLSPSPRKALRVAVYDFELAAVDNAIGAVVTDSTLAEVRKLAGISAIGMDEIRDMLSHEANKQILGCEEDSECLAEIAGALGVDQLVTGKLAKVDAQTVITIRRIDQNRAKVLDTYEQRLTDGSGEEFLATIGPGVEKLFPDHGLRGGMERGVPEEMALRLNPPPIPTWGFYSVAAAAVASAGAATGFGVAALVSKNEFESEVESGTNDAPAQGSEVVDLQDQFNSRRDLSNAFWISTGVFAIAATVMAFFTDWEGYQDAAERLQASP